MQATDGPKNMKDVVQRKFLDDIIGDANSKIFICYMLLNINKICD